MRQLADDEVVGRAGVVRDVADEERGGQVVGAHAAEGEDGRFEEARVYSYAGRRCFEGADERVPRRGVLAAAVAARGMNNCPWGGSVDAQV